MAKRVSARRIKAHRSYTSEEAADALGVSIATVRSWRGRGLNMMTGQIPHLILGSVLKDFVERRSMKAKRVLGAGEFFCMGCKAPRKAFGGMADYIPITPSRGRLEALCEACEGRCNRLVSEADISALAQILDIARRCTAKP